MLKINSKRATHCNSGTLYYKLQVLFEFGRRECKYNVKINDNNLKRSG